MLTTFELDEYVFGALDAGASGFLLKGGEPADLIHAIRVVVSGEALLAPSVTRRLIDTYLTTTQPTAQTTRDGLDQLTNREREVLGVRAGGALSAVVASNPSLEGPVTMGFHIALP